MTYALSFTEPTFTETVPDAGSRLTRFIAGLISQRASRIERVQARRTALATSEEARINAQMRYRRLRYRHMAG